MMYKGNDLIALGYKPGKWFGKALKSLNRCKLSQKDAEAYLAAVCPPPAIEPFLSPVAYHHNIRAEKQSEEANIRKVLETMDEVMKTPTVVTGAVMPDACPTGEKGQIPVGGVVATRNAIHPSMHSADVCCSVMMTYFNEEMPLSEMLDVAHSITHFGGGGRDELFPLPEELLEKIKGNRYLNNPRSIQAAKTHLGTQGDGNHFLYVGRSEKAGKPVMVTHHGSRGFGAGLFKEGMKMAEKFRKELSPATLKRNAWIPFDTPEGRSYWEALQIVREWTKLNHWLLHKHVIDKLNKSETKYLNFWNEHNFVFKDGDIFYHAKGATPLDNKFVPDSTNGFRIIPLNMAQPILVVRGKRTTSNLGFAPHGAGRNVSRSEHKRNLLGRSESKVFEEETKGLDVRFFSGNVDTSELPSAYKNAENVIAQIEEFKLGEVMDKILPYGCIMAGDWMKNRPWKNKKKL